MESQPQNPIQTRIDCMQRSRNFRQGGPDYFSHKHISERPSRSRSKGVRTRISKETYSHYLFPVRVWTPWVQLLLEGSPYQNF